MIAQAGCGSGQPRQAAKLGLGFGCAILLTACGVLSTVCSVAAGREAGLCSTSQQMINQCGNLSVCLAATLRPKWSRRFESRTTVSLQYFTVYNVHCCTLIHFQKISLSMRNAQWIQSLCRNIGTDKLNFKSSTTALYTQVYCELEPFILLARFLYALRIMEARQINKNIYQVRLNWDPRTNQSCRPAGLVHG